MNKIEVKPTDRVVFNLEVNQYDNSDEKKKALRKEIADKYGLPLSKVELNVSVVNIGENGEKLALTSSIINDIQEPEFQIELFKEYLKVNNIECDIEAIKEIDTYVNSFIDFESYSKFKQYTFQYVKWDNYLSFGEDNYFDFRNLKGIVLLNGIPENQCGKTTFAIDLLRFALFGKSNKCPTIKDVFNTHLPECTQVMVEVGLEIGGEDYVIRRIITRPPLKKRTAKSKCTQSLEYFKVSDGKAELISNCEGENNAETNNIIRDSIGSVEDFNLVVSATSLSLGELLRMGQTDKGKLFSRWLGLLSLEKKMETAKDLWKTKSRELTSTKVSKVEIENENEALEDTNKTLIENYKSHKASKEENEAQINQYREKERTLLSSKRPIHSGVDTLNLAQLERDIQSLSENYTRESTKYAIKVEERDKLLGFEFDIDHYNGKKVELQTLEAQLKDIEKSIVEKRAEYEYNKKQIEHITNLINLGQCPTCSQAVSAHTHSNALNELSVTKEQAIRSEGLQLKQASDTKKQEIATLNDYIRELELVRERVTQRERLNLEIVAIYAQMESYSSAIETKKLQMKSIKDNEESIKYNNTIDEQLIAVSGSIKSYENGRDFHNNQMISIEHTVKDNRARIAKNLSVIETLNKEEIEIRNWSIYQELVGKNGIVKIVLRKALPIINNEIARLLNGLCDFSVELSINEDNKVCIDMIQEGVRMDLGVCSSGFEGTFSALAIRSALGNIATISKPNFLVLDEIVETIGASNYDNLVELYKRIITNYQFILHITHNEMLTYMHDDVVSVCKEGKISKLLYKK